MTHIVGILLAGGRSRRYGTKNKLTQCGADGVAIGIKAACAMAAAVDELLVVIAPEEASSAALFAPDYPISRCPTSYKGMGHSIAHGVLQTPHADGWLIGLADMPYVRTTTHLRIRDALNLPDAIARPMYDDRVGHPVGFGKEYYGELIALNGDAGAQSIIMQHHSAVVFVPTEDSGVLIDIDRPEDLAMQGSSQT
jgi:molybdenum cofactor cytidylyltransferase